MNETIALLVISAAFGAAVLFHLWEAKAWRAERANLLDRLMARTYQEFVYSTKPDTTETPQLTTDEAEQAWYAAHERETGEAAA